MPQASVSEARSGRQELSLFEAGIRVSAVLARARGGVQETLDSANGRGLPLLTRGKPWDHVAWRIRRNPSPSGLFLTKHGLSKNIVACLAAS